MLVLGRKEGEVLVVGEAHIHIRRISGTRVSLAIEAPDHVKILRGELLCPPSIPQDGKAGRECCTTGQPGCGGQGGSPAGYDGL